jgi:hypothetical protein
MHESLVGGRVVLSCNRRISSLDQGLNRRVDEGLGPAFGAGILGCPCILSQPLVRRRDRVVRMNLRGGHDSGQVLLEELLELLDQVGWRQRASLSKNRLDLRCNTGIASLCRRRTGRGNLGNQRPCEAKEKAREHQTANVPAESVRLSDHGCLRANEQANICGSVYVTTGSGLAFEPIRSWRAGNDKSRLLGGQAKCSQPSMLRLP